MNRFEAEYEAQQEAAQELHTITADDLAGQFNQYSVDELVNLVMQNKKSFEVFDGDITRFITSASLAKDVSKDEDFAFDFVLQGLWCDSSEAVRKLVGDKMRQYARYQIQEIKDDFHDYMQGVE